MSKEINLLQNHKYASDHRINKVLIVRVISLIFLFTVSFLSITLYILIALSPLPSLEERKKDELKTLSLFHTNMAKIYITKERIGHIDKLLKERLLYGPALEGFADVISPQMEVKSMRVEDNKILFSISSTSLLEAENFIDAIYTRNTEKKLYKKISIVNLDLNNETRKYDLSMEFQKI